MRSWLTILTGLFAHWLLGGIVFREASYQALGSGLEHGLLHGVFLGEGLEFV